jgi:hypothetical protein
MMRIVYSVGNAVVERGESGRGPGRKEPFYSNATFGMKIPSNE